MRKIICVSICNILHCQSPSVFPFVTYCTVNPPPPDRPSISGTRRKHRTPFRGQINQYFSICRSRSQQTSFPPPPPTPSLLNQRATIGDSPWTGTSTLVRAWAPRHPMPRIELLHIPCVLSYPACCCGTTAACVCYAGSVISAKTACAGSTREDRLDASTRHPTPATARWSPPCASTPP